MISVKRVGIAMIGVVLSAQLLSAQDLSAYRDFHIGMDLASVVTETTASPSEAKVIHQRPAMIQELAWRPRPARTEPSRQADPVQQMVFSFFNDELFRIVVTYDREKIEGLTEKDLIENISAMYGTATTPAPIVTSAPLSQTSRDNGDNVVARWEDAEYSVNLIRSSVRVLTEHRDVFQAIGYSGSGRYHRSRQARQTGSATARSRTTKTAGVWIPASLKRRPGPPTSPHSVPSCGVEFMNVRPLHDRIVVQRLEEGEQQVGGIIIPDTAKERPQQGKVMAAGNGKVNDDGKRVLLDVKGGDQILFGKYAGQEIKLDGQEYLIMKEDEVLAVIEGNTNKKPVASQPSQIKKKR